MSGSFERNLSHFDTQKLTEPKKIKIKTQSQKILIRMYNVINVIQLHFQHARFIGVGENPRTKVSRA